MFEMGQKVWLYYGGSGEPEECTFIRADAKLLQPDRVLVRFPDDSDDDDLDAEHSSELYLTLLDALIAQTQWMGEREHKARRRFRDAEADMVYITKQLDDVLRRVRKLQGDTDV